MNVENPQEIITKTLQTEVAVDLDRLLMTKSVGIKPDPVSVFILKYIYVQHHTVGNVTMSELSNLLHESDLTIRKKVKALVKHNMVKLVKSANDKRVTYIMPTKPLIRHFEIHTHRLFETILQLSPLMQAVFSDSFERYKDHFKTHDNPSFLEAGEGLYDYYKKLDSYYMEDEKEDKKNSVK